MKVLKYIRNFFYHNSQKAILDICLPVMSIIDQVRYFFFYIRGKGNRLDYFKAITSKDDFKNMFGHFLRVGLLLDMIHYKWDELMGYTNPQYFFHNSFKNCYLIDPSLLDISYKVSNLKTGKELIELVAMLTNTSLATFKYHAGQVLYTKLCECKSQDMDDLLLAKKSEVSISKHQQHGT